MKNRRRGKPVAKYDAFHSDLQGFAEYFYIVSWNLEVRDKNRFKIALIGQLRNLLL